jgi:prepilin-type N-terminal cleavage/methylation domain-containing protein/prepilin-type processing-associated H-X9-DG protein
MKERTKARGQPRGFTLIELLVVVAIIAILISILLPALSKARKGARAAVCAANLHDVSAAFGTYLGENNAVYPFSYAYASNDMGDYTYPAQPTNIPHGYLHWSWMLYNGGEVNPKAFTCPEFPNKGCPRTYPGEDVQHREGGQAVPSLIEDKQAPRMAYTANAAVVPRNKFRRSDWPGHQRENRMVPEGRIIEPRGVILVTEFNKNWVLAGVKQGEQLVLSKSHRPINPFVHIGGSGGGTNEYSVHPDNPGFIYGTPSDRETYGLRPLSEIENMVGVIDGAAGPEINVVGRHHPGGDRFGGTANFLFTDGHVSRTTILQTMRQWQWGSAYYSLTGKNKVLREK